MPEFDRAGGRGDRRPRAARAARRDRRPRALQRARPRPTGRAGRPAPPRWPPAARPRAWRCRSTRIPPTVDGAAFDAKVAAAERRRERRLRALGRARPRRRWTGSTSWPRAASSASRRSCATRGSTTSRPPTTTCWAPGWSAPPRSACRCRARRAARPAAPRSQGADWRAWAASRPPEAELAAIERALELAEADRLLAARRARLDRRRGGGGRRGARPRRRRDAARPARTTSRWPRRTWSGSARRQVRAAAAAAPRERDALWRHLRAGRIALVASDHSPCPPAMKAGGFDAAWGGIAGAQTTLALLLDEGPARAACRSPALAELVTGAPAARLRLPKGRLEPGADADLALVDLRGASTRSAAARPAPRRTRSPAAAARTGRADARARRPCTTAASRPGARPSDKATGGDERSEDHRRPVRVPRALGAGGAPRRRAPRSRGCSRSATRSSTCAGAASPPGSRSAT